LTLLSELAAELAPQSAPAKAKGRQLSLKMRAVGILSRRDHSRFELQRKLAPYAESAEQIDKVIADLEQQGFFSEARFVTAFARRRGEKYGVARVTHELAPHKLAADLTVAAINDLKASEPTRAEAVWRRRFDQLPKTIEERAKQQRFLQQRGFSSAAIAAVLRGRVVVDPND
jgi:regulatory protein